LPNAGIVRVEAGKSEANFVGHVADVVTSTDVTVIATFKSFFPAPAKIITLHLIPGPPK